MKTLAELNAEAMAKAEFNEGRQLFFEKCLAELGDKPIQQQLLEMDVAKSYVAIFKTDVTYGGLHDGYFGRVFFIATDESILCYNRLGHRHRDVIYQTHQSYYDENGKEMAFGVGGWTVLPYGHTIRGIVPAEYQEECRKKWL
jgi:hypothetical protein